MRPLVLREIADTLGLHESTVSRVTTQKFMFTPRGIFELKYFFGSHVATETGGACSATAIRALIKQLVAAEDAKKPAFRQQDLRDPGPAGHRGRPPHHRQVPGVPADPAGQSAQDRSSNPPGSQPSRRSRDEPAPSPAITSRVTPAIRELRRVASSSGSTRHFDHVIDVNVILTGARSSTQKAEANVHLSRQGHLRASTSTATCTPPSTRSSTSSTARSSSTRNALHAHPHDALKRHSESWHPRRLRRARWRPADCRVWPCNTPSRIARRLRCNNRLNSGHAA